MSCLIVLMILLKRTILRSGARKVLDGIVLSDSGLKYENARIKEKKYVL